MEENLAPGRAVYVGAERRPYRVEGLRVAKRSRLKLVGVDTRAAAEGLRGQLIGVPLSEAVPLPEGRYYECQVIGSTVVTTSGETLGTVREILATGSNDVYVVQMAGGDLLVPAIHDVVLDFDAAARVLSVELPDGLR